MSVTSVAANVTFLVQFKKGNPIKWERFQTHLQSIDIKQFGTGEAVSSEGTRSQALAALHRDGEIVYLPKMRQITIAGSSLEAVVNLSNEITAILKEMFRSVERLKANVVFYEIRIKEELEPEDATPLEIMQFLTPPNLFKPFESALGMGKLNLFAYRFYHTSSTVDEDIRRIVPWYDVHLFPGIENPDRFVLDIVCRDNNQEMVAKNSHILHSEVMSFLRTIEKKVGKR